jgi:hypothetical protein
MDFKTLQSVTSDIPFSDSSFTIFSKGGIFSEQIFGPKNNYKCQCGHYSSKTLYKNMRCPKCGVLCGPSELRTTTYAKIEFGLPILKPTSKNFLKNVKLHPNNGDHYLHLNEDDIIISQQPSKIPIVVTGPISLFLGLFYIKKIYPTFAKLVDKIIKTSFTEEVLVIPPNSRPLTYDIIDRNNNFQKDKDINSKYESLLRLKIHNSDGIATYKRVATDVLTSMMNSEIPIKNNDLTDLDIISIIMSSVYLSMFPLILEKLKTKNGVIRDNYLARRIDYSGRAVIVPNPSLRAHEIIIPKFMFIKLFMMEFYYYLKNHVYKDSFDFLSENVINRPIVLSENMATIDKIEHIDSFVNWFFENAPEIDRLVVINRQPTMWELGCVAMKIKGLNNKHVIEINKETLPQQAADFDGDQVAIYKFHAHQSKQELIGKMYQLNLIKYSHNTNFIQSFTPESRFVLNDFLKNNTDYTINKITISRLTDLPESFDLYNKFETPVEFNEKTYSYGMCLINKWIRNLDVIEFKSSDDVIKNLYQNSKTNEIYRTKFCEIDNKLISLSTYSDKTSLKLPCDEIYSVLGSFSDINTLINNLPKNPYIGDIVFKVAVAKFYSRLDDKKTLGKLASLSGKTKKALPKSFVSIGYIVDNNNVISSDAIKPSFFSNISQDEFFNMCYGSRKGFVDKEDSVPVTGALLRTYAMILSVIEIVEDDCGTENYLEFKIKSVRFGKSKIGQYFLDDGILRVFREDDIEKFMGKTLKFRSVTLCNSKDFGVCKKCFGEYEKTEKTKYISMTIAQSVIERLSQTAMSSFHTSGSMTINTPPELISYFNDHMIDIFSQSDKCIVKFNETPSEKIKELISDIPGFISFGEKSCSFEIIEGASNEDVSVDISELKRIMSKQIDKQDNPINIQKDIMDFLEILLKFGDIYSTFVETMLCNLYFSKAENKNMLYRNAIHIIPSIRPHMKLNPRSIVDIISPVTSLLLSANKKTVGSYFTEKSETVKTKKYLFEKLWDGEPL